MADELFPDPKPSSWDVTFLTFLSRSRVLDFPASKKRAADELRQCRNKLSHEIKTTIEENEFEVSCMLVVVVFLFPFFVVVVVVVVFVVVVVVWAVGGATFTKNGG